MCARTVTDTEGTAGAHERTQTKRISVTCQEEQKKEGIKHAVWQINGILGEYFRNSRTDL